MCVWLALRRLPAPPQRQGRAAAQHAGLGAGSEAPACLNSSSCGAVICPRSSSRCSSSLAAWSGRRCTQGARGRGGFKLRWWWGGGEGGRGTSVPQGGGPLCHPCTIRTSRNRFCTRQTSDSVAAWKREPGAPARGLAMRATGCGGMQTSSCSRRSARPAHLDAQLLQGAGLHRCCHSRRRERGLGRSCQRLDAVGSLPRTRACSRHPQMRCCEFGVVAGKRRVLHTTSVMRAPFTCREGSGYPAQTNDIVMPS